MREPLEQLGLPDAPWIVEGTTQSETRLLTIADLDARRSRTTSQHCARAPAWSTPLWGRWRWRRRVSRKTPRSRRLYGRTDFRSAAGRVRDSRSLGRGARPPRRSARSVGARLRAPGGSRRRRRRPGLPRPRRARYLNRVREALADRHGRQLIAASAAPANPVSWRNLMRQGLEVRGLARMFGGHWRYLMLREESGIPAGAPARLVDALDIARQQRLLDRGCRGVLPGECRGRAAVAYAAGALARPRDRCAR